MRSTRDAEEHYSISFPLCLESGLKHKVIADYTKQQRQQTFLFNRAFHITLRFSKLCLAGFSECLAIFAFYLRANI